MKKLHSEATPPRAPSGSHPWADREAKLLAPYAMSSSQSAGRRHAEPHHPYRGPFQRDRDRIVHSAAFRRLSGKMQVFTGERGDYHRTRLTHTMEVTSIARTIGRTLRLNEDLIESLALMHDIGHPPFGHAGEDELNDALANEGGFSHNEFALTLVEQLENRYEDFDGLNLSLEVLEGQRCRTDKTNRDCSPLLEVQVVDAADSIAYDAHDVDDAVKLGLISLHDLSEVEWVNGVLEQIRATKPPMEGKTLRVALVHQLIDELVTSTLRSSMRRLEEVDWQDAGQARQPEPVIRPEATLEQAKKELEAFLYRRVYRHPNLLEVRQSAQIRVRRMIDHYSECADQLPASFRPRSEVVGLRRASAEYIAGMTDRFCISQYGRLFSPSN